MVYSSGWCGFVRRRMRKESKPMEWKLRSSAGLQELKTGLNQVMLICIEAQKSLVTRSSAGLGNNSISNIKIWHVLIGFLDSRLVGEIRGASKSGVRV